MRNALGRACEWLAAQLEEAARRLVCCPDCGRSEFYGKPCVIHSTMEG